jgi:anti-anti-sigma factor
MRDPAQFETSTMLDLDGRATITAAGELDASVARQLAGILEQAIRAPGAAQVCVDLAAVTFLDAAGITVLVRSYKLAYALRRGFSVRGALGSVRQVLEMTGVAQLLAEPHAAPTSLPERAPR